MKDNTRGSFSPEVLKLYRDIKATENSDERGELLLQLAHRFSEDYDATDDFFHEVFHSVVDCYHEHFLKYNQAGLRLGRVLMKAIAEQPSTEDTDPVPDGTFAPAMKTSIPN